MIKKDLIMRRILILLTLLCCALPCFAAAKLLHSYPAAGIYYYNIPDFKPESFVKPAEVKRNDLNYTMFVYTKPVNASNFKSVDGQTILNEAGWLFSMLSVGLKNKPDYYVSSSLNEAGYERINICKLDHTNNNQIKYTNDTESGDIVKQMTFNNGEFNIGSVCNPDYVPGNDI